MICLLCWKKGVFPLHSSVLECNGKTILFIGPSGAGKTTILFYLYHLLDANAVANDWIGISELPEGVHVTQRDSTISFDASTIKSIERYNKVLDDGIFDGFRGKLTSKPDFFKLGEVFDRVSNLPAKIDVIISVDISKGNGCFCIENIPTNNATELMIHETFWPPMGLGSFLIDCSGQILAPNSFNLNKNLKYSACDMINTLQNQVEFFRLSFSIDGLFENIEKLRQYFSYEK